MCDIFGDLRTVEVDGEEELQHAPVQEKLCNYIAKDIDDLHAEMQLGKEEKDIKIFEDRSSSGGP
jgi:hypothetical protein